MPRKILLIEPDYKNKYPPMGLMKISTYHKQLGDSVTFYKGDLKEFVLEDLFVELLEKLYNNDNTVEWVAHKDLIKDYLKFGKTASYEALTRISQNPIAAENLTYYKDYYRKRLYLKNPKWDRVCISTLFTFYWDKTIETINFCKQLCKEPKEVKVGGVAASLLSKEVEEATGIKPHIGLLDQAGVYDDNDIIIDRLPLDYSILYEIDYVYPENEGYYAYMTRGCVNRCPFCAVPKLEPNFDDHVSIIEQLEHVRQHYGEKRNLLLLDNNVLASIEFNQIIDEIQACGFRKDAMYTAPSKYNVAINGLILGDNDRGYIKTVIGLYKKLMPKLSGDKQTEAYALLQENRLLYVETARKENILKLNDYFKPLFEKYFKSVPKARFVDFNQGVDARLLDDEKMRKLAEIPIRPLRIAFDDWKMRDKYEAAVRLAARYEIKHMSNYLLYNYTEKPIDLYYRMKLNVELCEELDVNIYSFPMKYHPIQEPEYFKNRFYIGKEWNRKFIRSIQAILNSTKGKVGRGKEFFEEAFGRDEKEFEKLLYMPEVMIIYRMYYKNNGITEEWWNAFNSLPEDKLSQLKKFVEVNDFTDIHKWTKDKELLNVLSYYEIQREEAEKVLKINEAVKIFKNEI